MPVRRKALKADVDKLWELYNSARDGGHVVDAPWGFAEPKRHFEDEESLSRAHTATSCLPADVGNAPAEDASGSSPDDVAGKEDGGEGFGGGKTKSKPFKGLRRMLSALRNVFSRGP